MDKTCWSYSKLTSSIFSRVAYMLLFHRLVWQYRLISISIYSWYFYKYLQLCCHIRRFYEFSQDITNMLYLQLCGQLGQLLLPVVEEGLLLDNSLHLVFGVLHSPFWYLQGKVQYNHWASPTSILRIKGEKTTCQKILMTRIYTYIGLLISGLARAKLIYWTDF